MRKRKKATIEQIRKRITQVFYCGFGDSGTKRKDWVKAEAQRRKVSVSGLVWIALGKLTGHEFYIEHQDDVIHGTRQK